MSIRIDTVDAGYTAEARALLDSLDDTTFISLGVLFGSDLCALGGTAHPACWEDLKSTWQNLGDSERERLTHTSTMSLRDRNLVVGPPVGRGVAAQPNLTRADTKAGAPPLRPETPACPRRA
jgi:hypothetical protein